MKEIIRQGVEHVIKEGIKAKGIDKEGNNELKDLIANSLDLMRFLVAVEEYFDIYIDQQYLTIDKLNEIESIVDIIYEIKLGS